MKKLYSSSQDETVTHWPPRDTSAELNTGPHVIHVLNSLYQLPPIEISEGRGEHADKFKADNSGAPRRHGHSVLSQKY